MVDTIQASVARILHMKTLGQDSAVVMQASALLIVYVIDVATGVVGAKELLDYAYWQLYNSLADYMPYVMMVTEHGLQRLPECLEVLAGLTRAR